PLDEIVFDAFASPFRPAAPERKAAPAEAATTAEAAGGLQERVRRFEAELIQQALVADRFNQRRAARRLGLTYDQLRHYLRKHGIARAR
ncbi:MAG TPA: helix-turn-helix domain-containing protein, partial [Candidatus Sulfotelmatobacter sp.]|nr:helix-turn-helix domain-containing protein [Candidatus Sulfotelmatobacter sp.]